MKNRLLLPLLPIILWGTSMCLNSLYIFITGNGANEMSAIIAALITAAASFFVWLGSERKGTKSERKGTKAVKEKLEEIGSDTRAVPQKADSIKADTEDIQRNVTELVADLNYRKGMRSESSVRTQEALKAGMDAVFEENARLNKTIKEQAEEIGVLKAKNLSLEKQLYGYKKQERSRSDMARGER